MKTRKILAILLSLVLVTIAISESCLVSAASNPISNFSSKKFIVNNANLDKALQSGCTLIKKSKHISTVSCSYPVFSTLMSNLGLQEDIEIYGTNENANVQVDATRASINFWSTGQGRKIVVLDTGYDYTHPELSSSYLGGFDFVNNDTDPMDDHGHGTHVAGIITADGLNPKVRGIAPNASIISGKVLNDHNSGFISLIIEAIYWAVDGPDGIYGTSDDFNADAISMSLGSKPPYVYNNTICDDLLPDMTNAIKYADSHNVVVVISAGNNGEEGVGFPGCISTALTVGSVNSQDIVALDSGRGPALDIVAPGVNILSTWLGSDYATLSGTSMAVPMVSGTIALLKAKKPNLTSTEIKNALTKSAKDLGIKGYDWSYGFGRLDVYSAFKQILRSKVIKPPIPTAA